MLMVRIYANQIIRPLDRYPDANHSGAAPYR